MLISYEAVPEIKLLLLQFKQTGVQNLPFIRSSRDAIFKFKDSIL